MNHLPQPKLFVVECYTLHFQMCRETKTILTARLSKPNLSANFLSTILSWDRESTIESSTALAL